MRTFYTSVVELRQQYSGDFVTEPYECGWADEAIFFVTVEQALTDFELVSATVQISPDGIQWTDHDTELPAARGPGLVAAVVTGFGGWIRLRGAVSGRAQLSVRLALKG